MKPHPPRNSRRERSCEARAAGLSPSFCADADHRAPRAALLAPVRPRALRAAQRRPRGRAIPQRRRAVHAGPERRAVRRHPGRTGSSAGSACGAPRRARTPTSAWASSAWPCPRSCRRCCPRSRSGGAWPARPGGAGLATEGARASLRHAFDELELEAVISIIDPDNERSIRVAEKLGMRRGAAPRASADPPATARVRDFLAGCGFFTRAVLDPRGAARIRSVQTRNRVAESEAQGLRGPPL